MSKEKKKKLTQKEKLFIDYYFVCKFNGTQAAIRAGYSERTAGVIASENLKKPYIQEAIQARLAEVHMSADEALVLLSDQARGDMAQLMEVGSMGFNLDMQKAQEAGLTKLIKRVKQKTTTIIGKKESDDDKEITELEVELYDAQSALDKILRVHKKYTDPADDGKNITINVNLKADDA